MDPTLNWPQPIPAARQGTSAPPAQGGAPAGHWRVNPHLSPAAVERFKAQAPNYGSDLGAPTSGHVWWPQNPNRGMQPLDVPDVFGPAHGLADVLDKIVPAPESETWFDAVVRSMNDPAAGGPVQFVPGGGISVWHPATVPSEDLQRALAQWLADHPTFSTPQR